MFSVVTLDGQDPIAMSVSNCQAVLKMVIVPNLWNVFVNTDMRVIFATKQNVEMVAIRPLVFVKNQVNAGAI